MIEGGDVSTKFTNGIMQAFSRPEAALKKQKKLEALS
jgi:hypothetical protein